MFCREAMGSTLRSLAGRHRLLAVHLSTSTPATVVAQPHGFRVYLQQQSRRSCVEVAAAKGDRPSTSGRSATNESRPRLAKVLAACGVASRRACEELISEGRVRVNGRVVSEQGTTIDPTTDRVELLVKYSVNLHRGHRVRRHNLIYPEPDKGYICSSSDVSGRGKLAVQLLNPWLEQWRRNSKDTKRLPPRFFTVGRLDVASSGLIFITNDGHWANRVIHPSSGLTKEYVVGLGRDASRPQLQALAAGTEVAGTFVSPVEVEVLGDSRRLRIVVQEGKKHEVRELVKAAGLELTSLKRVRIGGFRLPRDLGIGGFRELKPSDLRTVTDLAAQEAASASGETRQAVQRQAAAQRAAAAAASVPRALRGMGEEVLERLRKARE
ncbi:hypothetical protein VOLCADRAFT_93239 [Volvox carteri f. nagariensis]|uniref:RNA-binding S4 domain-containing protein n=1 Tax=Volvox carteri f. nagariensis TaxID=3068 RepID=D8U1N1_VOLCA|nr:uncharacterized protein VOLCADRAFT_93239 [Volvox carteri f. nagariensis]EFJ46367.1 hypothetical protein VOLCADRAFT_93239 [Volvox carteri f. nagariensis]|eukprot:XP_002952520.1 hypothetical protein VOLCADRAFT_93239 [Volvox carteri f. nagariensis]